MACFLNDGCLLYDFQNSPPFHLAQRSRGYDANLVTNLGLIANGMYVHGRLSTNLLFVKRMRNLVFIDDFHGLVAGFGPDESNEFLTIVSCGFCTHLKKYLILLGLMKRGANAGTVSSYALEEMMFFDLSGLLSDLQMQKFVT